MAGGHQNGTEAGQQRPGGYPLHFEERRRGPYRNMDLSLESALSATGEEIDLPGRMAGRSLEEWNAAYTKVESYFHALRVRNRVLLGRLVIHVLKRAMQRAPRETQLSAT